MSDLHSRLVMEVSSQHDSDGPVDEANVVLPSIQRDIHPEPKPNGPYFEPHAWGTKMLRETNSCKRRRVAARRFSKPKLSGHKMRHARQRQTSRDEILRQLPLLWGSADSRNTDEMGRRQHFFFHDTACSLAYDIALKNPKNRSFRRVVYDANNITIVDNATEGVRCLDKQSGELIFHLLPRRVALSVGLKRRSLILYAQTQHFLTRQRNSLPDTGRGDSHKFLYDGKYVCLGGKATHDGRITFAECPSGMRISDLDSKQFDADVGFKSLRNRAINLSRRYLPVEYCKGFEQASRLAGFGADRNNLCLSVALSTNMQPCAHTDADFGLTVAQFFVLSQEANQSLLDRLVPNHDYNAKPVVHFMFPTYRYAVAIRPGDVLIFNPKVYHCCSAKLCGYETFDLNVMTMYSKAAVIGKNNNNLQLTYAQRQALRSMKHEDRIAN
jgi:hypothetical protein